MTLNDYVKESKGELSDEKYGLVDSAVIRALPKDENGDVDFEQLGSQIGSFVTNLLNKGQTENCDDDGEFNGDELFMSFVRFMSDEVLEKTCQSGMGKIARGLILKSPLSEKLIEFVIGLRH